MLATEAPFPQFFDTNGSPLSRGSLYFGVANLNPETNPITVYWDSAGTQPAAQPILTLNGYATRNGAPAVVYANSDYSLNVRNGRGNLVYYFPSAIAGSNAYLLQSQNGSQFVGHIQPGTGAVVTTVSRYLQQIVSVFGFMTAAQQADVQAGTKSIDVTAAVLSANTYAASVGAKLWFPSGHYLLTDLSITGPINWTGDGDDSTFLNFTSGTFGLTSTLSNVDHNVNISDMTFRTTGTTGYGLDVNYTLTGFAGRDEQRLKTANLHFEGVIRLSHGWVAPMRMTNINGSYHDNLWCNGRSTGTASNLEADNTVSTQAVVITGVQYPTDHRFISPTFYSFANCIVADGAVEGITLDTPIAVNVGRLLDWTPTGGYGGRPGAKVLNGHVNSYYGVVRLNAIQQVQLELGEYYHNQGATSNWVAHDLTDVIDGTIRGNQYYRYASGAMLSTADSFAGTQQNNIVVEDNIYGGTYTVLDTAISVAATVPTGSITIGKSNKFNGTYRVAAVTLAGGNYQVIGERGMSVYLTTGQSIPNNVETLLAWDTTDYDPLGLWVNGRTTFTIPAKKNVSYIEVSGTVMWDANATGYREVRIKRNGSPVVIINANTTAGGVVCGQNFFKAIKVSDGDTIAITVTQTSGGAINAQGSGFTSLKINVQS